MISPALLLAVASASATADAPTEMIVQTPKGIEDERGYVRWQLSYHVSISPYVKDYRRCLNYANRIARGVPDMEMQHRADLPRCVKARNTAVASSIDVLERRGLTDLMSGEQVERAFEVIGLIHIDRGKNLDDQFVKRVQQFEAQGTPADQ